jgi:4-hydroxybenzoate polyprenyltransferase
MLNFTALQPGRHIRFVFFGNYFYGLCAMALAIEASLQQRYPLNGPLFFILLFAATVLYYTTAYLLTETSADSQVERSAWYARNRTLMWGSQYFFALVLLAGGAWFLFHNLSGFLNRSLAEWLLMVVFPFTSALYYGSSHVRLRHINLRKVGWLKPFIIGFTWGGMVTVYPVLYYAIEHNTPFIPTWIGLFLFIKNFMFVTVLCIMFDIKDYAMDYNTDIKTFVVQFGLRKTIFSIIIPLCTIGLASFLWYAAVNHFHPVKILLNTIPFIAVIAVAYYLHHRRNIFFYLMIIDGLMLLKAVCGSVAMLYF